MSDFYNKYPYTDFHELNLDWVIERVKTLTEDWLTTQQEWNDTKEQWQNLYNYVHDYFDNLNVQNEINVKLDAMMQDGSFMYIATPVINAKIHDELPDLVENQIDDVVADQIDDVVADQIDDVVADQIGDTVATAAAAWLDDHITQPTTPVIDTSLTVAGAAADSKQAGDAVKLAISIANAIHQNIVIEHQESVTPNTGGHEYTVDYPIPKGTKILLENLSSDTTISVNGIKFDGSYETLSASLGYGLSTEITVQNDIFGIRSYCGGGGDWNFRITFGYSGQDSFILYKVDQSGTLTDEEKATARNNIGAADVDNVITTSVFDIYGGTHFHNGYIAWSNGAFSPVANGLYSDPIPVNKGDIIEYSLTAIGQVGTVIAAFDSNDDYIQASSVKGTGTGGSWTLNTGNYTVSSGVAYIRFSSNSSYKSTDLAKRIRYITLKDVIDNDIWHNKKWAAFGTSITAEAWDTIFLQYTGKYVRYLLEMSGLKVTNYGISGASFLNNIMNKVMTTDLTGYDLVTIEGAVNDFATSKPLGIIGDKSMSTFAGTIYQMANYVYSTCNATLIFITDHVGRYVHINPAPNGSNFYGDCDPDKINNLGLKQIDYINMIIDQCKYFGIPCITAGQDAGINLMTGNQYLQDHIHQSEAGGEQYAQTIWKELKDIKPRIIP